MKNIQKILAFVLALMMLLSMAACGQQPEEPSTEPATQPPETTEATEPPTEAATEYTEPLQDGYNQVTFYYYSPDGYENCDMWIWFPNQDGKGHLFHECEYGAKVVINVPEGVEEVGFIVRRDCSDPGGTSWGSATKDFESDRFAPVTGRETFVYLVTGDANQYISKDGGKTLDMAKKFTMASMIDQYAIKYTITPKTTISDLSQIKVYQGDREVEIASLSSLGKEASQGIVELTEELDLSASYRIAITGFGEKEVIPMDIFDSQYFADNYHYDGNDLGAVIHGSNTTFKVWAPTASKVVLNLFEAGDGVDAYKNVEMVKGEKGVWSHTEACGHGTYYTYSVTTCVGTQEAVDIYAKAAGVNGNRGMVVDLSKTNPAGWAGDKVADPIDHYSEAIIWEVHVRDFTNKIESAQYKGKYLGFTEKGLVNEAGNPIGIDYLKQLGITHVHLLPVYDFATIDETTPEDEFNWGYDPKNYNVPEGSYSTDPYNGEVRINEYKQMVMALHEAGISVIMDMVYNHTYDGNSSFNKIVPYYYYRYNTNGTNTSASGCGNDTASERYMFGKFMVDSTAYWVDEYHLDGLRFDLMGLHDVQTMQEVEAAVHGINPNAIIYGEGWTMGATIDGSAQANQTNISQITATGKGIGAVAVFNDVIRDGLKGSVFEKTGRGFINGSVGAGTVADLIFGLKGGEGMGQGWSVKDAMVINYMSAHDNNTLWDKLLLSNPEADDDTRNRMNNLGAAIILVSKGTPFWQAGEEMLRTKDGDENSYKSSDAINNIDWSVLKEGNREYTTMLYYKGLIEMRKAYDIFTDPDTVVNAEQLGSGIVAVTYENGSQKALVLINPHNTDLPYTLEGTWSLVATATEAGSAVLAEETGSVQVDGIGVRVYVQE